MTSNLTAQFLGDPDSWDAITLQLWSVHTLWGGHIISVAWPGTTIVRRIRQGAQHEQRYDFVLTREEMAVLLHLLISHDLLAVEPPTRTMLVPDETVTVLTVRKGRRAFTLTTWDRDPSDERVRAIIAALYDLNQRTKGLMPQYDGPYQSGRGVD